MIKKYLRRAEFEFSRPGARFVPAREDVMLVSYPKSGNTWVRALVAELVRSQPTLQDMERLVPDVYGSRGGIIRKAHRFPCGGRLIKSHESFRPDYRRVIYIARDPRAVCVSYYHYLRGAQKDNRFERLTLDEFVPLFLAGELESFGTWGEHNTSWRCAERAEILHLKYEQLLSDPFQNLSRICEFLGLDRSRDEIAAAVSNCSIENLKKKEAREGTAWHVRKNADPALRFFRNGTSEGAAELSPAALGQIETQWAAPMSELGYTLKNTQP